MPGRKYTAGSGYRYGFNGKENDNEVKGEGNQQDYGMRIDDCRIARFFSSDPLTKKYPELTPYQFASNRPIDGIDLDGAEWLLKTTNSETTAHIKLNDEYTIKLKVINHSTLTDEQLKQKLSQAKFGTEQILKNTYTTSSNFSGKPITLTSSVKIEFDFSNTKADADQGFTLEAVDYIEPAYGQKMGQITLGQVRVVGNTQSNKISLVVADEITIQTPVEKYRSPNSMVSVATVLAEEIGHTGSLGHTGKEGIPGYRPDETDVLVQNYTNSTDGKTNVMVQGGQAGTSSTVNLVQFNKIKKQVIHDTTKKTTPASGKSSP